LQRHLETGAGDEFRRAEPVGKANTNGQFFLNVLGGDAVDLRGLTCDRCAITEPLVGLRGFVA